MSGRQFVTVHLGHRFYKNPVKGAGPHSGFTLREFQAMAKKATKVKSAMDYPEHEKTYKAFLSLSVWTIVVCVALLVAMAFGFFGGGGLIGGTLLFLVMVAAAYFAL